MYIIKGNEAVFITSIKVLGCYVIISSVGKTIEYLYRDYKSAKEAYDYIIKEMTSGTCAVKESLLGSFIVTNYI